MAGNQEELVILGSTGSIGRSTLEVIRHNGGRFRVSGLACSANVELMAEQIVEFRPQVVSVGVGRADQLKDLLGKEGEKTVILEGDEGNLEVAAGTKARKLIAAIVGAAGVAPIMAAITANKTIALANKEALVLTGEIMMEAARSRQVTILPIDSEHNAVFQVLQGSQRQHIAHITLTASGGPFRTKPIERFAEITLKDALNHPNWRMGPKITIDSATMMNKALEVIEARWLFDLDPDRIRVLVHPQSIVHSMVTFIDGATIAQMGVPDMKTPIAYALAYPDRVPSGSAFLNLEKQKQLTFEPPDRKKFPAIQLAYDALKMGGGVAAALNGANEALVALFLKERISFAEIVVRLQEVLSTISKRREDRGWMREHAHLYRIETVQDALRADRWGRNFVASSGRCPVEKQDGCAVKAGRPALAAR